MVIWSTIRYHHRSWLTRLRWMCMPLTTSNCSDIGSSINDCNGAAISASEYYMCRRRVDVTSINHQLQLSQNLSNHHSKMMSTAINRKYMLLCAQPRYSEQAHRRWEQYLYILLDKVLIYRLGNGILILLCWKFKVWFYYSDAIHCTIQG